MKTIKQNKISINTSISEITLGTMRFLEKSLTPNEVTDIIDSCFDNGIDTHHSSSEYESYNLYTEGLAKSKNAQKIKHIAKLAAPHFDESTFSSERLTTAVDNYLRTLKKDRIEVLQWLVRSSPINDIERLKIINENTNEINEVLGKLKQEGKIETVYSFPYSVVFAEEILKKISEVDGIISYLNLLELDYVDIARKNKFISIRPLAAGKILNKTHSIGLKKALDFPLSFKNSLSTVISLNSKANVETLIKALSNHN